MSRRLESLERQRDELEMLIAIEEIESLGEWQRKKHTLQAETVARQIARDRDRLRLLLDDHDGARRRPVPDSPIDEGLGGMSALLQSRLRWRPALNRDDQRTMRATRDAFSV